MEFSIKDIARIVGAETPRHDDNVDELMIDSRSVVKPGATLFVALRTPNNDGHLYIAQLIQRGVKNFIVDHIPARLESENVNFIKVDNTLDALRQIGSACRERLKGTVVGITGSCGKTVVKEMAAEVLANGGLKVSRSPRSYNSQIGVPLSLWMADEDADVVLIEAGISRPGEMEQLRRMIRPQIGVMTVIGAEHDSDFVDRAEKAAEKALLFKDCTKVIYADSSLATAALEASAPSAEIIPVDVCTTSAACNAPLVERLAELLGRPYSNCRHAAETVTRLNVIEGANNCKLIHDRFTADLQSLRLALDFMRRQVPETMRKTLIVATTGFHGTPDEIRCAAADYGVDRVIMLADESEADRLMPDDFYDEAIMIKGSPALDLGSVYWRLEARQHETLMEVNLDAIVHNFNFFRSKVKPTTGIICMLKAHGYGAGSVELARTLQSQGAAYLAVAVVDEGVELRKAGITMPIMVLNPRAQNYRIMFDYRLEPEIYSFEMLDEILHSAERCGVKHYPVHIKLETGMRRLGFVKEDLPRLADLVCGTDALEVSSVFSHLACADDPAEDDYTLGQFEYFSSCCDYLDSRLPKAPRRHILNSTGIIRFPQMQYDFVRLGIGLYGVPTLFDGSEDGLRNVSTLTSVIISIKEWPAGTTIGYNRRGKLSRDSRIATIPVGYADGIDRHLGYGNASVLVNGHRCPTVGSICMDICMVDITDVECHVGDRVELFGDTITPIELADTLGTIPYEILTSISPRVKRVYYRE